MRKNIMLILSLMLLFCNTAFAGADVWKAPGYDFKKIHTARIEDTVVSDISGINCLSLRKVCDFANWRKSAYLKGVTVTHSDTADCRIVVDLSNFSLSVFWQPSSAVAEEQESRDYEQIKRGDTIFTDSKVTRRIWTVPKIQQGYLWVKYDVSVNVHVYDKANQEIFRFSQTDEPKGSLMRGYNKIMTNFFKKFSDALD